MRKVLIGGLCASLIAGLSACNDKTAETQAETAKQPEVAKTATAAAVSQALLGD